MLMRIFTTSTAIALFYATTGVDAAAGARRGSIIGSARGGARSRNKQAPSESAQKQQTLESILSILPREYTFGL